MNPIKAEEKKQIKKVSKENRRKKKNALINCRDGKEFWTTQNQFWQWLREGVITKGGDNPLTGEFVHANEEKAVVICNTILNLAHPNHLSEAIYSRRFRAN